MAPVNRRQFITTAASVPMVGDIITPIMAGLLDRNGEAIHHHPNRDLAIGTVCIYGHMQITGKQLATIRDDIAWKNLIDEQCEKLKVSMYEYVKTVAMRTAPSDAYPEKPDRIKIVDMRREGDRFVYETKQS